MTRLPAPGCGLRAYPGPGAWPCPAVRVGRLPGCGLVRATGCYGCPPRSPARPHGVHDQTRVAPPSVPGPAHPPVSEAVSATPPKTCRAGWVTAAAMDGRGSECVLEVRPSGRDPPGAARLPPEPADTPARSPRDTCRASSGHNVVRFRGASNGAPDAACGLIRATGCPPRARARPRGSAITPAQCLRPLQDRQTPRPPEPLRQRRRRRAAPGGSRQQPWMAAVASAYRKYARAAVTRPVRRGSGRSRRTQRPLCRGCLQRELPTTTATGPAVRVERHPDAACGVIRATGLSRPSHGPATRTPARSATRPPSASGRVRNRQTRPSPKPRPHAALDVPCRVGHGSGHDGRGSECVHGGTPPDRSHARNAAEDVPHRAGHGSGHGWPR